MSDHTISIIVGGRTLLTTNESVTVQVTNGRITSLDEGDAYLNVKFTHEGAITDLIDAGGVVEATSSIMYDDLLFGLTPLE